MDRNRGFVGVEDDDLEQSTGRISSDHQDPVAALRHGAERHSHSGLDVFVADAVSSSPVGDLHPDRLSCRPSISGQSARTAIASWEGGGFRRNVVRRLAAPATAPSSLPPPLCRLLSAASSLPPPLCRLLASRNPGELR